jgi:exodeoxyribonuclease VIII
MPTHVMVDLETLSTGPNAAILSIGAVKFDPFDSDVQLDSFYQPIEAASCQALGLTISAETVLWWMETPQDSARIRYLNERHMDLPSTLEGFLSWFGNESLPVWGNGATFDNVILRNAIEKVGYEVPWRFWHDRCFRTLKNMAPGVEAPAPEIRHHALCDAVSQTRHLQAIVKHLGVEAL